MRASTLTLVLLLGTSRAIAADDLGATDGADQGINEVEAEQATKASQAFIARFEATFNRTPTISAGLGFAHIATDNPAALLDGRLIGETEPAIHCVGGRAVALQGFIEGEGDGEEPYFLHVTNPASAGSPLIFQDPTFFDALVAIEGVYYAALGGDAAEAPVTQGGPFAEAVLVDSSPRDADDAHPYDCLVSFMLVPAPQGLYDDEDPSGFGGGGWADDLFGEGEFDDIMGEDGYAAEEL